MRLGKRERRRLILCSALRTETHTKKELSVERYGSPCMAASDALLNLHVFFALSGRFFPNGGVLSSGGLTGSVFGLDITQDDNSAASHGGGNSGSGNNSGVANAPANNSNNNINSNGGKSSSSPLFSPSDASEISPFEQASQFAAQVSLFVFVVFFSNSNPYMRTSCLKHLFVLAFKHFQDTFMIVVHFIFCHNLHFF